MTPTFSGECQIVAWADSNARGPTVTFRLQSSEELEAFRGVTLAKKGMSGDRFAVVAVLIHDDETLDGDDTLPFAPETSTAQDLVDELARTGGSVELLPPAGEGKVYMPDADGTLRAREIGESKSRFPNGLAGLAVMWSTMPDHWQWLEEEFGVPVPDEATVKDLICSICGIESRKELNTNPQAAAVYIDSIKEPYAASRQLRGLE
jgi:hypothetical protein